ncbi:MAG: aminopeptidase [Desulfobacterales bacterium]|nr:aminopeptidase [Desulfobacterales bacterium]
MFSELQLTRYAEVLLWGLGVARRQRFRPRDVILLRFDPPAVRLAEILYRCILEKGMHPVIRMNPTAAMEQSFFQCATDPQLLFTSPGEEPLYRQLNGSIFLHAPESLTHLSGVDPKKIGRAAAGKKFLRDIMTERESSGRLSWTLCLFPTEELARQAGLSLQEYTRQVVRACFLNRVDPVEHWQQLYLRARSMKQRLNRMKTTGYRVESENIDLYISAGEKRKWVGISGRNIPSFELFTSPDWRQTRGVFYADQPSFRSGNFVKGIRLEFSRGRVVKASADRGEEFVRSQIRLDNGADKIGEFSLTDRRFSRIGRFMANTLYDENFGGRYGNCHVALGSSYENTYRGRQADLTPQRKRELGFNDSALHWDLVNTEKKRVQAIGPGGRARTIYENGEFLF